LGRPAFSLSRSEPLPEAMTGASDDTAISFMAAMSSWRDGALSMDAPRTPLHALGRLLRAYFWERSPDYEPEARVYTFTPTTLKALWVQRVRWNASRLESLLGNSKFVPDEEKPEDAVGSVNGLAVTPFGGEVLSVEAAWMEGKAGFTCTGNLRDVMEESAKAALAYTRSKAKEFGIQPHRFESSKIHLHVPAGAVPKDGPSAGIAMGTALVSALTGARVRGDVAMTGEITIKGKILPIGGVKDKVLAAHRLGIRLVVLPEGNRADIEEVPKQVRKSMKFIWVEHMDQVLAAALRPEELLGLGMSGGHGTAS